MSMNAKCAHLVRLLLLITILSSSFATGVYAAPVPDPRPPSFDDPSLQVLPAWARLPASSAPPQAPSTSAISAVSLSPRASQPQKENDPSTARSPLEAPIEVFTNTWSYSTIGLVYNPGQDYVRYAHESQSSSHNPTIYDVDYAVAHTLLFSLALSTRNSGWPWQIDNCNGAGYDFVSDTYFMPDYNGDLSYADDNIVEIRPDGTILNAWEMDDEVGSNDSADGSEIDSIIDIAVVPGTPTRYFATAAYDGAVVYEIELNKTGTWWTPNSWRTVMTYTGAVSDTFSDNLGIDYDAQNERLYHSGWHTTTILVTDLNMNPVTEISATFDCPGAGGYNSGVTFIEGSNPPEVWVTDFSSDQTTRCEAPSGAVSPGPRWEKRVDGQPWDPDVSVTKQLGQAITVTDVIFALEPFTLTETWDPDRLALVGLDIFPPVGQVTPLSDGLRIVGLAGPPEVVTVTKWLRVEPCDWLSTTLREELLIAGDPGLSEVRPVLVKKEQPQLEISSAYASEVYAGGIASFTLSYSNTGGLENDVWITNTFPLTAPFIYADPFPDNVGPDGSWTRWNVGDLEKGARDEIDVYVFISETVPPSNTVTIWDGIFDHVGMLRDETWINLHITGTFPTIHWEKWIDDQPWRPGISITRQTSDTLLIEEIIDPQGNPDGFSFIEEWNPDELALLPGWSVEPATYGIYAANPVSGVWTLVVPPGVNLGPVHIVKVFHVEPCNWNETVLWEALQVGTSPFRPRPVVVNKLPPELWIDSFFDVHVYGGDETEFVLAYGNIGGRESAFSIRSAFPPEAAFVSASLTPTVEGPDWVEWRFPEGLDMDQGGRITVTVAITDGLPPSTTIRIWDVIQNHLDEPVDETVVAYHVPRPEWRKTINGELWDPAFVTEPPVQTGDILSVTDVITTRSAFELREFWNPERLDLIDAEWTVGDVISDPAYLAWTISAGMPEVVTLTKWFQVQPCTWTHTLLGEELWVEGEPVDIRRVFVEKFPPDLRLESVGGGEAYPGWPTAFTLVYSNVGGYEHDAWITNTFPISAPFVTASLTPTREADDGTWAVWDLGELETDERGTIDVTVALTESLVASDTVEIWDGIFHDETWLIADTVITYHVVALPPPPPEPAWIKEIWVNQEGPLSPSESPITVWPSDTVQIVDRVYVTYTGNVTFTLVETWTAPLDLEGESHSSGSVSADANALRWLNQPAAPNAWHTLTKTFTVLSGTWQSALITESLWVMDADTQLEDQVPTFQQGTAPQFPLYLPLVLRFGTSSP